jgi:hypothetical protein
LIVFLIDTHSYSLFFANVKISPLFVHCTIASHLGFPSAFWLFLNSIAPG